MVERSEPLMYPLCWMVSPGGVVGGGVAEVHVTRAVGDVDDGIVGERVARIAEVEDATLTRGALGDRGLVQVTVRCARLGGEAGTAVL